MLYRFFRKTQYSALAIAGCDVFFALTVSPGQPGRYTLLVQPSLKEA